MFKNEVNTSGGFKSKQCQQLLTEPPPENQGPTGKKKKKKGKRKSRKQLGN